MIGQIAIIKTLMISKIVHILLYLPRPSEESFKTIENVFIHFLWNGKPLKFKLSTLENLTVNGGLQFPNIRKIDKIMKASWIKRIYKSENGWAATPFFYGLNMIYNYGDIFLQKTPQIIGNMFWNDVVQSVYSVYKNATVRSLEHLLAMPLWYNTKSFLNL